MSTGNKKIEIEIAATGGDQTAGEIRKVDAAQQDLGSGGGKTNAKLEEFASSGKKVTAAAVDMRFGLANVGYQVQDFAVQVASGTSAARAFGQQAPQLLSAFGPWGIALGTIVALGAPLVGQLFQQADATDRLSESMEEARLKTIDLAVAEENAKRIQEEWKQTSFELNESVRDATTARYGYNDAVRSGLELLKEEQEARKQVAEAKGRRELEAAADDPVKQQEIRNRLRGESQNREIADMEETQRKRRELLERDSKQQMEVGENGPAAVNAIRAAAEKAAREALEFEQAKVNAEGNAKYLNEAAQNAGNDQERRGYQRQADVAAKSARDWDAMAKEARTLEGNLNQSAKDAAKAVSDTIEKLQKEMQKLADEIRKTDTQIATKKQVNAEDNAIGEIQLDRARKEAAKRAEEERKKQAEEQERKKDRERTDAIAMAALGMDASEAAGGKGGNSRGAAAIKRKAEAVMANPSKQGADDLANLVERLLDWAQRQGAGDDPKFRNLEQRMKTLEARQKNGRDGR